MYKLVITVVVVIGLKTMLVIILNSRYLIIIITFLFIQ